MEGRKGGLRGRGEGEGGLRKGGSFIFIFKHRKGGLLDQKGFSMNAMEQTYLDVEKLIKKVVWDFKKRYGGDFQELLGDAELTFVMAYKNWKKDGEKFTTYLCKSIKNNLLKKYQEQRNSIEAHPLMDIEAAAKDYHKGMCDFLDSFTGDTLYIAQTVTDPDKFTAIYKAYKHISSYQLKDRYCIIQHLNKDLKWSQTRIKSAFNEIKKIIAMK